LDLLAIETFLVIDPVKESGSEHKARQIIEQRQPRFA